MNHLNEGAPLPANNGKRWFKIRSPKGANPLTVTLLGNTIQGEYAHWRGREVWCQQTTECVHCKERMPFQWAGYIAAYDHDAGERVVAKLTEGAARQLLPIFAERETLRGVQVELRRKFPTKKNSAVSVKVLSLADVEWLMAEHDIKDSLARIWGINAVWLDREFGKTKQAPQRPGVLGAEMPYRAEDEPDEGPSGEQWRRLKQVLGGVGQME